MKYIETKFNSDQKQKKKKKDWKIELIVNKETTKKIKKREYLQIVHENCSENFR